MSNIHLQAVPLLEDLEEDQYFWSVWCGGGERGRWRLASYAMGRGLDLIAPAVENHKGLIIREVTPSVSV